jgi:hypothetical protein
VFSEIENAVYFFVARIYMAYPSLFMLVFVILRIK